MVVPLICSTIKIIVGKASPLPIPTTQVLPATATPGVRGVFNDHPAQEICVRTLLQPHDGMPMRLKSLDNIGNKLLHLGASAYSAPDEIRYPPRDHLQGMACELCNARKTMGNDRVVCTRLGMKTTCVECDEYKRPCTFTHMAIMSGRVDLQRASMFPPYNREGTKRLAGNRVVKEF
ncbi:hypothetical protein BAUCODRAFT_29063 [Baudoinia panamericana UAMH 10762]|uniref:Uncharacterized protein n=1 Tax=Baudoinia panamericana (strain UAMH 10762) TaxID=717646 RepID=M2N962_BAUPA|nr:uncharacterized protein BAUCODRAFT_29063 [Baudoinia panamericana UAMH 10762]EMD00704.1 hypothetical protein BAUCODRAFT_29063 [Baudoinia panamericana UAMH 10762]